MLNGTIFCSTIVLAKFIRFVLEKFQNNSKGLSYNRSRTNLKNFYGTIAEHPSNNVPFYVLLMCLNYSRNF